MYEINKIYEHKITINKSDFIAMLYPIKTKDDISSCLSDAKKKYAKATHYCYAATLGDQRNWAIYQDDGEPKGTAGPPILDVMDHHKLTYTLCVVIRYFGGIKLGAGGLVRAYAKSTAEVIKLAQLMTKKEMYGYQITFPYTLINHIDQLIDAHQISHKTFLDHVTYDIYLEHSDLSFIDDIKHLITVKKIDNTFIYVPIN